MVDSETLEAIAGDDSRVRYTDDVSELFEFLTSLAAYVCNDPPPSLRRKLPVRALGVRRQRHQWLWHLLVLVEREVRLLLRQYPGYDQVQEDLRALRLVLLYTSAVTKDRTRAGLVGGTAEHCCCSVTCLLTPALTPNPDPVCGARPYI